jgi:predicted GNAT superfamily acetyltransferase
MPYHIRKVPRSKYDQIRALCDDLLLREDKSSVWKSGGEYWGAYDGEGNLVGFGGLVRSVRWSDVVYLHSAGVAMSARGNGLQRKLIRARVHWAKAHGFCWATTDTVVYNPISSRNLIRCGFLPYWPRYRWATDQSCYWSKKL